VTRKPRPPIAAAPPRLRQRQRAGGTWRIWWEPRPCDVKLGFTPVELDAARASWSVAEARRLNAELALAQTTGKRAPARAQARTVSDLIGQYRQSVTFRTDLAPATRTFYVALLNQIDDKWGVRRVIDFDKPVMFAWYQTLHAAKGARMAQALIRMMSVLFSHAELLGWRAADTNPCFKLKVSTPQGRARVASWPEIAALLAVAEAEGLHAMALAIRLSLYHGQRQTDVMQARRDAFRLVQAIPFGETAARPVWVWFFRRSKRRNDASLPVHPDVIPHLRAVLADAGTATAPRLGTDALLVDEAVGRPYDVHLFGHRWSQIRAKAAQGEGMAALATLQFRDLRRTFGVLARAGGASPGDTGDVLGNSAANDPVLGEIYMQPTFSTTSRAIGAVKTPKAKGAE
jgi:integrase